jgi:hypothetical protein
MHGWMRLRYLNEQAIIAGSFADRETATEDNTSNEQGIITCSFGLSRATDKQSVIYLFRNPYRGYRGHIPVIETRKGRAYGEFLLP